MQRVFSFLGLGRLSGRVFEILIAWVPGRVWLLRQQCRIVPSVVLAGVMQSVFVVSGFGPLVQEGLLKF